MTSNNAVPPPLKHINSSEPQHQHCLHQYTYLLRFTFSSKALSSRVLFLSSLFVCPFCYIWFLVSFHCCSFHLSLPSLFSSLFPFIFSSFPLLFFHYVSLPFLLPSILLILLTFSFHFPAYLSFFSLNSLSFPFCFHFLSVKFLIPLLSILYHLSLS